MPYGKARPAGRWLNVSQDGIRLLVGGPVWPGDTLAVKLFILGPAAWFEEAAEVMYAQPRAEAGYVVGAAFRGPLGARLVAMLA